MSAQAPKKTAGSRRLLLAEPAIWLVIAAGMWVYSYRFDQELSSYALGPVWWPRAVILLIALAAVGAFLHDMHRLGTWGGTSRTAAGTEDGAEAEMDGQARLRLGAAIIVPLIYAWLLPRAGYYIATPVFIATYMSILGVSRWRTIALTTIAAYAALLLVFTRLLYIPLPTGNWPGFYDFSNWLLVLLRA
jgi:hypothetical protein